jgi:hypothetical protein
MEVGIGDGQFLPGPNECRDAMSRGERLLDQRNAGGASGAEDAQIHRGLLPSRSAGGARERLIIGSFPPLILGRIGDHPGNPRLDAVPVILTGLEEHSIARSTEAAAFASLLNLASRYAGRWTASPQSQRLIAENLFAARGANSVPISVRGQIGLTQRQSHGGFLRRPSRGGGGELFVHMAAAATRVAAA